MKLFSELIVTVLFFTLYTPLSIAIWYEMGMTASLSIIMLIGLTTILLYLMVEFARCEIRTFLRSRRRNYIILKGDPVIEQEDESNEFIGFRMLFSQNNRR